MLLDQSRCRYKSQSRCCRVPMANAFYPRQASMKTQRLNTPDSIFGPKLKDPRFGTIIESSSGSHHSWVVTRVGKSMSMCIVFDGRLFELEEDAPAKPRSDGRRQPRQRQGHHVRSTEYSSWFLTSVSSQSNTSPKEIRGFLISILSLGFTCCPFLPTVQKSHPCRTVMSNDLTPPKRRMLNLIICKLCPSQYLNEKSAIAKSAT